MILKKIKLVLSGFVLLSIILTSCDHQTRTSVDTTPIASGELAAVSSTPITPTPPLNSTVDQTTIAKEDNSARAIGKLLLGQFVVKPANQAAVTQLGAPSCYGLETDFRWTGDYQVMWESEGKLVEVLTLPRDFEIIQQVETPLTMRNFTMGDTTIVAYTPRYTDCHALETYLFGVSKGEAFPITFVMKPELTWTSISQLPHRSFQVIQNELIVTGGYGAGADFIEVYHFQYDSKKRAMIWNRTDQVKPNEIEFDS